MGPSFDLLFQVILHSVQRQVELTCSPSCPLLVQSLPVFQIKADRAMILVMPRIFQNIYLKGFFETAVGPALGETPIS
jgi:hypothetical protein